MQPIATAIVGVSGFGRVHYQDLIRGAERGVLAPVAACVINQEEEAEKCGVLRDLGAELFDDFDAMLAAKGGELELVQLPVGIPLHRPMCEAALGAGLNVLVEKPLAGSAADGEAIRAARDAAGKVCAVGFQRMFDPSTWALKEALLGGAIGELRSITGYGLWPRSRSYYDRNGWAGRMHLDGGVPVLDSPVQNAMAHYLMLMLFLGGRELGAAAEVTSVDAELYRCNEIESPDTCALRATTAVGLPISFVATHACGTNDGPVIKIQGSAGHAEWGYGGDIDRVVIVPDRGARREFTALPGAEIRPLLIDAVVVAVRGDVASRVCDVDHALAHTRVIDAMHRATEVRTVDPQHYAIDPRDGDPVRLLEGIDDLLHAHLDHGRLPSEVGAPWASPGGSASVAVS